jgi:hypothetical protein
MTLEKLFFSKTKIISDAVLPLQNLRTLTSVVGRSQRSASRFRNFIPSEENSRHPSERRLIGPQFRFCRGGEDKTLTPLCNEPAEYVSGLKSLFCHPDSSGTVNSYCYTSYRICSGLATNNSNETVE